MLGPRQAKGGGRGGMHRAVHPELTIDLHATSIVVS